MDVTKYYTKDQIINAGKTALRARLVSKLNAANKGEWGDGWCQTPQGIMVRRKAAKDLPAFYSKRINRELQIGMGHNATAKKDMQLFTEVHGSFLA